MNLVRAVKKYLGKFAGRARSSEAFVLGTQLAQASAAQQRHEEVGGSRHSPLADLRYSDVECRLWRWTDSPVDRCIETKVASFAGAGETERSSMRDSLAMDDFYALMTFAKRCALATLRSGDANKIESAFAAMAMIELERIDWRDLLVTNRLVRYAGKRLGAPVGDLLNRTIQMAEPQTAAALRKDGKTLVNLPQSCGYREVCTSEGVALFDTGFEHFSPKAELTQIAFKVAVALEDNGYEIGRVQIASDMPLTWLNSRDGPAIARMVRKFSGCICIDGVPRADPAPRTSGQSLLVFLAEAASEMDAREIAAAAECASDPLRVQLGLASRRLCAVIIQRSWMADTPPLEDAHSLERLRVAFERLLH